MDHSRAFLESSPPETTLAPSQMHSSWPAIRTVFGIRAIWLIAVIVICAAEGSVGVDFYPGHAYDALGINEAGAIGSTANASQILDAGALRAGLLRRRFRIARMVWDSFGALAGCLAILDLLIGGVEVLEVEQTNLNLVVGCFGV